MHWWKTRSQIYPFPARRFFSAKEPDLSKQRSGFLSKPPPLHQGFLSFNKGVSMPQMLKRIIYIGGRERRTEEREQAQSAPCHLPPPRLKCVWKRQQLEMLLLIPIPRSPFDSQVRVVAARRKGGKGRGKMWGGLLGDRCHACDPGQSGAVISW